MHMCTNSGQNLEWAMITNATRSHQRKVMEVRPRPVEAQETAANVYPQGQLFFRTWISARHFGHVFFQDRPEDSCFSSDSSRFFLSAII